MDSGVYDAVLIANIFVFCSVCFFFIRQGYASVYHPIFYYLFFHGLVFVLRPLFVEFYDYRFVYNLYRFWPSADVKVAAVLAANLGLLSIVAGAHLYSRKAPVRPSLYIREKVNDIHVASFFVATALCLPLIVLSLLRFNSEFTVGENNLSGMVQDIYTMQTIHTTSTGYLYDANIMLGSLSISALLLFRFRPLAFVPLIVFVIARAYAGVARWTFVLTLASFALLYCYERRLKWFDWISAVTGAGTVMLFSMLGRARDLFRAWIEGTNAFTTERTFSAGYFDNLDYANIEFLQYLIAYIPKQTGSYTYFTQALQVFTEPVPRMWWSDKPIGAPIKFFNLFDYGFPIGITYSLPGDGWQSLGYVGVAVYCFLAGLFLGWLYYKFAKSAKTVFQVCAYAIVLPLVIQWARDGLLLSIFKFAFFPLIPIVIWNLLYRVMSAPAIAKPSSAFSRGQRRPQTPNQ